MKLNAMYILCNVLIFVYLSGFEKYDKIQIRPHLKLELQLNGLP